LSLQILLPRLSKEVSADFRFGRYLLGALTFGMADNIMIERILVALFPFQAIASSIGFENHIDDCVQLRQ
jgi:hypothetical protein